MKAKTREFSLSQRRFLNKINRVLKEQKFVIDKKKERAIERQVLGKRRYFYLVAKRIEESKQVERFVKIPRNNSKILLGPFQRQIEFAKFLKKAGSVNTRGVVDSNLDISKGVPFAVMETFYHGDCKIGFIEKNDKVALLGNKEAKSVISELINLHGIPVKKYSKNSLKNLKKHPGDYKKFRLKIFKYLNRKVKPLDLDRRLKPEPFHKTLERRIKISELKNKVKDILSDLEPLIDAEDNHCLTFVHGDLSPCNLYVFDSGKVEFLDFEWVGICQNSSIAMIIDFGNFRARSWNNKKFRKMLDQKLLEHYKKIGKEELGKAIVRMSILRSHSILAGAFENYDLPKQEQSIEKIRRQETEADLVEVFR